jgi:3-mercaptopyruvate sulfurtransferase SseA
VALQLKRAGVKKVRPLAGGFEGWRKLGLPLEPLTAESEAMLLAQRDGLESV